MVTPHPARAGGGTAAQELAHFRLVVIQLLARDGDDVFESTGQQLRPQVGEVIVPTDPGSQLGREISIRGVHEFQILQMIGRRAFRRLGERIAQVIRHRREKFVEGGKKVVVSGFLARPVAHGPGIDDGIVENVVLVGAADGRLAGEAVAGVVARRRNQNGSRAVDAKAVLGGEVNEALGVNRPGKVDVKVAALRHFAQESEQKSGFPSNGVEVTSGPLLSGIFLLRQDGWRGQRHRENQQPGDSSHRNPPDSNGHSTRWRFFASSKVRGF